MLCGLMNDLLTLDYTGADDFALVGADLDLDTLEQAQSNASRLLLQGHCEFLEMNAWELADSNAFDAIVCSGLTSYQPCNDLVVDLYNRFYEALKPGRLLITNYVTPPPTLTKDCEWRTDEVSSRGLLPAKLIFSDLLQASWSHPRSTGWTTTQLRQTGFHEIGVEAHHGRVFPTVYATK